MKIIKCNDCGEKKEEIEFNYDYFKSKYNKICSECEDIKERTEKNKKRKEK